MAISGHQTMFYGLKTFVLVTEHGQTVKFFLTPGSYSDTTPYRFYDFNLSEQAWNTGDKAYKDCRVENVIKGCQLENNYTF
jgi:hypothetical protein